MTPVVRVSGTADAAEIAAVLAAISAAATRGPERSAYDRWRTGRVAALRADERR